MTKAKQAGYQAMHDELEQLLEQLQDDGIDIDEALTLYERGRQLAAQLQAYLKEAENTITELKLPADA